MTKDMTSGNPAKLILFFALPLIAGNIFQQFYSMADTVIVGRTIGVNALAAVVCTGSLTFFIIGFTVILTVIAFFIARPALELLNTPAEIIDDAESYLKVVFLGLSATVLFNLVSNMMRALGDSRIPLYFLVLACCINIVLDFVLILVFRMGVAGAGVATVFSQLLSGICCCIFIRKKMPALWVSEKHFRLSSHEIIQHLKVALPMAFQMSIIAIGALILQAALNGLGAVAVASYTAAQKIDTIATMPINSMGSAMATYSAQNYGAGRISRIRKGVFQCILMSVSFSIIMGAVNILAGSQLAAVFVGKGETEVLKLAKTYLSISGMNYWILALLFIYRFTLQGLGNSLVPTIAGTMELIMRAVAALFLAQHFGFAGACTANPLAWLGACVPLCIAYYLYIRKLEKRMV